jgi:Domain of unknown function (DUF4388)
VQTQGSLSHHSLDSVLLDLQSKRATGALTVSSPAGRCALYLLFGHLFHAAGDPGQGSEAVITALSWTLGDFVFDPRASLPMEQTISAATGELLAEAERRRSMRGPGPAAPPAERPAPPAVAQPSGASPLAAQPAGTQPAGVAAPGAQAAGVHAPDARRPAADVVPGTPVRAAPVSGGAPPAPPTRDTAWARRPMVPPAVRQAPSLERSLSQGSDQLWPLPTGTPICRGLSSSLVDIAKVLRTIQSDRLTGYLALRGAGFAGVVTLDGGRVLGACFRDGAVTDHELGLEQLRRRMERGDGVLDVAELRQETVLALSQLFASRPLLTGLRGRFVDFDQLLRYLSEERFEGGVVVESGSDTGVVLMCGGSLAGTYTSSQRDLTHSTFAVHGLAAQPPARIEVKGRATSTAAADLAVPVYERI